MIFNFLLLPKVDNNYLPFSPKPIASIVQTVKAPEPVPVTPVPVPEPEPIKPIYPDNLYEWGNCTWYVKSRRPDLPNNLGNADTWYYYAKSQDYAVGATPKVGAVGVDTSGYYGHVVYVESVNTNGTIDISEMNVLGLGVMSYRTLPADSFIYIY